MDTLDVVRSRRVGGGVAGLLAAILVAGCGGAATTPGTSSPPMSTAPVSAGAPAGGTSNTPCPTPTSSVTVGPTARPVASAAFVTGWPTVRRSGITMTGKVVDEHSEFYAPPAAIAIAVTMTGLAPGESVVLDGAADYDFDMLGCGVVPSPCSPGSVTADPSVDLCQPAYSERASGTAIATAVAKADDAGRATGTLRFVVAQSRRPCPAGETLPWYLASGAWRARVTDEAHGLTLVGPPDWNIGP